MYIYDTHLDKVQGTRHTYNLGDLRREDTVYILVVCSNCKLSGMPMPTEISQ